MAAPKQIATQFVTNHQGRRIYKHNGSSTFVAANTGAHSRQRSPALGGAAGLKETKLFQSTMPLQSTQNILNGGGDSTSKAESKKASAEAGSTVVSSGGFTMTVTAVQQVVPA